MEQRLKYMVRVFCMTYNHAPYIEKAMIGFCMQETTFPFVCVIVDDASTDGEQKVIQDYLNKHFVLTGNEDYHRDETEDYVRIFTRHKTNCNCYFAVVYLKYNHYSLKKNIGLYYKEWTNTKYIAWCEGDDYWISPEKLQKQVDFLEQHPKHTLCVHAYQKYIMNDSNISTEIIRNYPCDMEVMPDKDVLKGTGMLAATASMVYRRSAVVDYPEWAKKAPLGDKSLQLVLFSRGSIGYINEVMSVYRVGSVGSWTLRMRDSLKYRLRTQKSVVKFYHDFDRWTGGKYHHQIEVGLKEFKRLSLLGNVQIILRKPYTFIKNVLKKKR